jgi:hypothetical protein
MKTEFRLVRQGLPQEQQDSGLGDSVERPGLPARQKGLLCDGPQVFIQLGLASGRGIRQLVSQLIAHDAPGCRKELFVAFAPAARANQNAPVHKWLEIPRILASARTESRKIVSAHNQNAVCAVLDGE